MQRGGTVGGMMIHPFCSGFSLYAWAGPTICPHWMHMPEAPFHIYILLSMTLHFNHARAVNKKNLLHWRKWCDAHSLAEWLTGEDCHADISVSLFGWRIINNSICAWCIYTTWKHTWTLKKPFFFGRRWTEYWIIQLSTQGRFWWMNPIDKMIHLIIIHVT